jgi:hypothetical protein
MVTARHGISLLHLYLQAAAAELSAAADETIENMKVVKVFAGAEGRQLSRLWGLVQAAHVAALRVLGLQVRNLRSTRLAGGMGAD